MNFVFRVDSSIKIGSGHLIRCLTLAKLLKKKGHICKFICRDHRGNLIEKIKKENFEVNILHNIEGTEERLSSNKKVSIYTSWLGASWHQDADQTINTLDNNKIDWLIIDHYGIDIKWEQKLRLYTRKIMVIDDLANRDHDCDLLLDQNLISNFKIRYQNLLPNYCRNLLGPSYALLQPEYEILRKKAFSRTGPAKNILVYFGDGDQYNLTESVLSAFIKLNREDINLDVVISSKNIKKEYFYKLAKKNKKISINSNLSSLAPLILKADLAFGASGSTSWERCCLGLPSIVITVAENQKPIAKELSRKGLIHLLGHYDEIKSNSIYNAMKAFIEKKLVNWSEDCKLLTDGSGTKKVATILEESL